MQPARRRTGRIPCRPRLRAAVDHRPLNRRSSPRSLANSGFRTANNGNGHSPTEVQGCRRRKSRSLRVVSMCRSQARGRRCAGAQAPRYHPACHAMAWPLDEGCDGPTRSALLSWRQYRSRLFFRRLPGDRRIDAVMWILRRAANRTQASAALASARLSAPSTRRVLVAK
jgi:hypothetical protein